MIFNECDVEKEFLKMGIRPHYNGFKYLVDLFMLFCNDTAIPLSRHSAELCKRNGMSSKSLHSTIYHCFEMSNNYKTIKETLFDVYYKLKHKE